MSIIEPSVKKIAIFRKYREYIMHKLQGIHKRYIKYYELWICTTTRIFVFLMSCQSAWAPNKFSFNIIMLFGCMHNKYTNPKFKRNKHSRSKENFITKRHTVRSLSLNSNAVSNVESVSCVMQVYWYIECFMLSKITISVNTNPVHQIDH